MDPQIKGMLDRATAVLATMAIGWLVKRGWLGESDAAQLSPLVVVLLPALFWGWWNNRPQAQLQKAAAVTGIDGKKTVVIGPPELANATPETNIISTGASQAAINAAIATAVAQPVGK